MTATALSSSPRGYATRWSPLLDGELRLTARDVLFDIVKVLPAPGSAAGPSLASGEAGLAVFHAYLVQWGLLSAQKVELHRELTFAHLQSAFDQLPAAAERFDLYSSFVGVAWAAQHIQGMGVLEDSDELCDDVDAAVLEGLRTHASSMLCELIVGLSGIGVYGLARSHRPAGRQIVEQVTRALEDSTVRHQGLRTWFHSPERMSVYGATKAPEGCFNLGLSHGVPGALVFLARAAACGVRSARELLAEARQWLLLQQRSYKNGARYGYSVEDGAAFHSEGARISWCYGDLGVSAALLLVARCARRPEWEATALDVAYAAARRSAQETSIHDAMLCHGAFGNAHLFSRLYAASGDRTFREAALHWTRTGLAIRSDDALTAGFRAWVPTQPDEPARDPWVRCFGMLEGIGGVGLALLGMITPIEPAWDEVLMVNIPSIGA